MIPVNTGAFFDFIKERESIRLLKEAGLPRPWTSDKILQDYKFTNVRRHHDWTSTQLRKNLYSKHWFADRESILMNCALSRYFGTAEFSEAIGWQEFGSIDFDMIKETAERRLFLGKRVFTGAYVITNQGISAPKQEVVVDNFLKDLQARAEGICHIVQMTRSWRQVAKAMSSINGFGGSGFMTKEILLDTMMTGFWGGDRVNIDGDQYTFPIDYDSWTPIGPGGLRGCSRLMGNEDPKSVKLKEDRALQVILDLTNAQVDYWPEEYGRLYPTDIQFQLCEFDKYERVRLGQGRPRSRYSPR